MSRLERRVRVSAWRICDGWRGGEGEWVETRVRHGGGLVNGLERREVHGRLKWVCMKGKEGVCEKWGKYLWGACEHSLHPCCQEWRTSLYALCVPNDACRQNNSIITRSVIIVRPVYHCTF